jgi:hypothetical protein
MAKPLGQVSIFAGFARDKPPAAAPQSVRGAFSQVDKEAAQGHRRQKEMLIQSRARSPMETAAKKTGKRSGNRVIFETPDFSGCIAA